jgi:putative nucleotidyltransferase with HDIG domain
MIERSNFFAELVRALSLAIDLDESAKLYHGSYVALVASQLAERILPEEKCILFNAGLLHDVGGVGVLSKILHDINPTSTREKKEILDHPYRGAEILRLCPIPLDGLHRMADYILEHHEQWDGKGYPSKKRGDEILLGSQILRAADALDVYRFRTGKHHPDDLKEALEIIKISGEVSPYMLKELEDLVKRESLSPPKDKRKIREEIDTVWKRYRAEAKWEVKSPENRSSLVFLFAKIIDSKHPYTYGHSERVTTYSVQIARMMGLSRKDVELIKLAAPLHDIGKLSVPRSLLDKPAAFSDEEWEIVKRHAAVGFSVLEQFSTLKPLSFATLHHERWDGKGYPLGLKGDEIPLGARIIAAADILDALTSKRPYRKPFTFYEALNVIREEKGKKLDPKVVEVVEELFAQDRATCLTQ